MVQPGNTEKKIFIGNLPPDCREDELRSCFGTYGEIVDLHILAAHPKTGLRCALLVYKDSQSAEDAISALDGVYKLRRDAEQPVKVSWAAKSKDRGFGGLQEGFQGQDGSGVQGSDGYKLFVGGLPLDCSEDELRQVFGTYGEVKKVLLMPHPHSGRMAALVFYSSLEEAETAIHCLDRTYKIRVDAELPIEVRWATKKTPASMPYQQAQEIPKDGGNGFKLFVGGLPSDCQDQELLHVFGTYGQVLRVHIMPPHAQTGRVAAFVFYARSEEAFTAIQTLNNVYKIREDADHPIEVRWAVAKTGKGGYGYPNQVDGGGGKGFGGTAALGWQGDSSGWYGKGNSWQDNTKSSWQTSGWSSSSAGGAPDRSWGQSGGCLTSGRDFDGCKSFSGGKGGSLCESERTVAVENLPGDITEDSLQYVFSTYGKLQKISITPGHNNRGRSEASAFVEFCEPYDAETAVLTLNETYEIRPGCGPIKVRKVDAASRSTPY